MTEGVILRGIGGFYTVQEADGSLLTCRARGRFRLDGVTPTVGDNVLVRIEEPHGLMDTILPRKNLLTRPPVANVDTMILVITGSNPEPDLLLADKLLIQAQIAGANVLICINKCDISDEETVVSIAREYAAFPVASVSAKTGQGIHHLMPQLQSRICCLAGQSGVGKSTLINALVNGIHLATGEISGRIQRGKHTTREVELLPLPWGGLVADTPGFSVYELSAKLSKDLGSYYPEFERWTGECRFTRCLHDNEPDCAVKEAVQRGEIHQQRYTRYLTIMSELRNQKRK
jgi:ribosome biogenesis GTPase / thiamine phosphate phosphatase